MKRLRRVMVLAVLVLALMAAGAPAGAGEYTLGVGDVLRITVWGHADLTTEVAVRPDGYLSFPLVGDLWAVDKTPREVRAELQSLLAEFIVKPQVTVIVTQFRTLHVQVLGEVRESGYYQLKAGARLSDVLALAGGPTTTADLSGVTVTRYVLDASGTERTEVMHIDVNKFLTAGDAQSNPIIESGDLVFVPPSGRVAIFGEVRSPASYDLGRGEGLLDLLAMAGGALDTADLERVVVTSHTGSAAVERLVDVQELLSGRGQAVHLQPNDVVFVPKKQQVMVLGAVRNPGIYPLHSEARLIDLIARAGGLLPTGDATAVSITRSGVEQEILVADIQPALSGRPGGDNPTLQPDDLIFVPEGYQNALVLGEVRSPGSFEVREQTRVLDLLAKAGGTSDRAGEELTLLRDGVAAVIDLGALERLGLQNEKVLPGDVIYVAEGSRQVLVLGEVEKPGSYQFRRGDRLLDAIGYAGGLTADALEEQVSLSRETEQGAEVLTFNFRELMSNRFLPENLPLQSGDVIIVPRATRGVIVLGEVQRPGYYQYKYGDSILDAIMLAGGFLESADEQEVSLTRQSPEGTVVETINFGQLQEDRFLAGDRLLEDGDLIVVPRSSRSALVLGEVRDPGYYVFSAGQTYLDLIGRAGGFTADADPARVAVTREELDGVVTETVNLDVLTGSDYSRKLVGGEVISVPKADNRVLVFGDVVRAGAYTLPPQGQLLDILAEAGGLQSNLGTEQVVVTRQLPDGERIWQVSFAQLMGAQSEHNLSLSGGDVVYVPAARKQILVLGMVKNPGVYNLPVGARLMDAIGLAGGPLDRAALENVGIYRDGSIEQAEQVAMGQDKQLFTGDVKENPMLQPGDIIYIPETTKPDWTKIFGFVGAISSFKSAIFNIFDW
jgi:polysaccharide export outer membrane protein